MWTLPSKVVSLDCLVCPDSISLVAAGCADGRAAVFDVDAWSVVKSEGTWRASGGAGKSGISMKTCITSKKEKWEGVCVFSWGWFLPKFAPLPLFYKFLYGQAMCSHAALIFFPRTASTYDPIMYQIHTSKDWQTYLPSLPVLLAWSGLASPSF